MCRVTHKAIKVHGGQSRSREHSVERIGSTGILACALVNYRDARITEIYEGTSEIQCLVISSWVLKS